MAILTRNGKLVTRNGKPLTGDADNCECCGGTTPPICNTIDYVTLEFSGTSNLILGTGVGGCSTCDSSDDSGPILEMDEIFGSPVVLSWSCSGNSLNDSLVATEAIRFRGLGDFDPCISCDPDCSYSHSWTYDIDYDGDDLEVVVVLDDLAWNENDNTGLVLAEITLTWNESGYWEGTNSSSSTIASCQTCGYIEAIGRCSDACDYFDVILSIGGSSSYNLAVGGTCKVTPTLL